MKRAIANLFVVSITLLLLSSCVGSVSSAPAPAAADKPSTDSGVMLLYDTTFGTPCVYTLYNDAGEALWSVQRNERPLRIVRSGGDRYYVHYMYLTDNGFEYGLICLGMDGNELWRDVFDKPIVNVITALPSGGVCVFNLPNKGSMRCAVYSPDGEKTIIAPSAELAEVWMIYSAQTSADGRIWLHCAYQEKDESDRYSALLVLDSEFNVVDRFTLPHEEWLQTVTFHKETGHVFLGCVRFDDERMGRDGFWYALDENLELLYRQEEPEKPVYDIVGLGDGSCIISYLYGSVSAPPYSLRVYDDKFALINTIDGEESYTLFSDLTGGYYAASHQSAVGISVAFGSSIPRNLTISRYDQNHHLLWEKTFMAEDTATQVGFELEPVYNLVEFD